MVLLGTDSNLYETWSPSGGATWNGQTKLGPAGTAPGLAVVPGNGGDPDNIQLLATFLAGGNVAYSGLLTRSLTVAGS